MVLEGLLALVERLRERIDTHGDALRRNEALTRYMLIDPMLRELGWDTSDPDVVIPEYSSGNGRADYALLSDGKPIIMVEAKKLGEPLQSAVEQGIQYCLMQGTGYFSATDGRRWEVYDTHKRVPIDEKRVVSFDLNGPSAAAACLQALSLWRPSMVSGGVQPGHPPVVGLPGKSPIETGTEPPAGTGVQPPLDTNETGWEPISTLKPGPVSETPPPSEILFPDNSHARIGKWVDFAQAVVRWLTDNNFLTASHCPIQTRTGKHYILATGPTHPDGQPMRYYKKVNSLYLNTSYNGSSLVRNTQRIIEHAGQDPAQFKVRFP